MMKWLICLATTLVFLSCKKELTSTVPVQDHVDSVNNEVKYDGQFMNGPYGAVSGNIKLYKDSSNVYQVALIDVVISNGPDLHVYLSQEEQPVHFIDLGKLKSTAGTQVYSINSVPDFTQYGYVLIHCQKYNHLFGSARLIP